MGINECQKLHLLLLIRIKNFHLILVWFRRKFSWLISLTISNGEKMVSHEKEVGSCEHI